MYNNEDLERFYFKYQTEALPHGQSLQSFCLNNNVPYNIFSKWYKDSANREQDIKLCPKLTAYANTTIQYKLI